MALQQEIDKMRAEIRTDDYNMSIGEWLSLYEKEEIDIHPEFQRFFRWSDLQKTKLIESILLGIPIPLVFVAQREDGIWDVVDGLQRLSTIFQFAGILKGEEGCLVSPLVLSGTDYLPDLAGKVWDNPDDLKNSLTQAQRLQIKRAKIGVSIILKESDPRSKYDLFQRLNTGGSPLSDQEGRNCILVMVNREMYAWMRDLGDDPCFRECIALTDRAIDEQYDMELVLRFLTLRQLREADLKNIGDLNDFLTKKMIEFAESASYDREEEGRIFRFTFQLLLEVTRDNSFRRYDHHNQRFTGGFLVSGYEAIALGIGHNHSAIAKSRDSYLGQLEGKVRDLWKNEEFKSSSGSGIRASTRIPRVVPLGRKLFKP